ncbi:MAG TPA: hypothetical protein PLN69_07755 [bacterium]|nr:hypothetical protein [bacterium]
MTRQKIRSKKIRKVSAALAAFLLLVVPELACSTDIDGFGLKWKGVPGGECYYETSLLGSGDFMEGQGSELIAVDYSGLAHVLQWNGTGFDEMWVSESAEQTAAVLSADVDGDGFDSAVFIDSRGKITVWDDPDGMFEPLCADCLAGCCGEYSIYAAAVVDFNSDMKEDLLALARTEEQEFLLELYWKDEGFEIFYVKPLDTGHDYTSIFVHSGRRAVDDCLLFGTDAAGLPFLDEVYLGEEAVNIYRSCELGGYGPVLDDLTLVDWPGGRSDEFLTITRAEDGGRHLRLMDPLRGGSPRLIGNIENAVEFIHMTDLNGDDQKELVLSDPYDCLVSAYSTSEFRFIVNGKRLDSKGRILRLSDKRLFVDASLFGNYDLHREMKYATMSNDKNSLVFEFGDNKVLFKTPDIEETPEADIAFVNIPAGIFIDPLAAAEYIDIRCERDLLADLLKIDFNGRTNK